MKLLFSGDWHDSSLEWLLHKFSSEFVTREDLQVVLRDLELKILKNISHHISVTRQAPTPEMVAPAVRDAGLPGITEAVSRLWGGACAEYCVALLPLETAPLLPSLAPPKILHTELV